MAIERVPTAWDGLAIDGRAWDQIYVWCTVAPSVAGAPQGSPDGVEPYATQSVTKNVLAGVSTVASVDAIGLYTLPGRQFVQLNGFTGGTFFIAGAPG